jgi:hypothetical protein
MKERNEDVRTAKSLFAEYTRLKKRAEVPGIPPIEKEYTMKMVNTVKSRIDFRLLAPHKKEEPKDDVYYRS